MTKKETPSFGAPSKTTVTVDTLHHNKKMIIYQLSSPGLNGMPQLMMTHLFVAPSASLRPILQHISQHLAGEKLGSDGWHLMSIVDGSSASRFGKLYAIQIGWFLQVKVNIDNSWQKNTSSISIIGPFFKINLISSSGNSFVEIPQVNWRANSFGKKISLTPRSQVLKSLSCLGFPMTPSAASKHVWMLHWQSSHYKIVQYISSRWAPTRYKWSCEAPINGLINGKLGAYIYI